MTAADSIRAIERDLAIVMKLRTKLDPATGLTIDVRIGGGEAAYDVRGLEIAHNCDEILRLMQASLELSREAYNTFARRELRDLCEVLGLEVPS